MSLEKNKDDYEEIGSVWMARKWGKRKMLIFLFLFFFL